MQVVLVAKILEHESALGYFSGWIRHWPQWDDTVLK
jgi:hypothetical protein